MSDNSKYVDERVVEMRIDNKKFESGAKQTISTLEKLEKALKLKSDTSALDSLEKSVGKFDASPMSSSLEKVQMSFSALEVVGMRVIQNLTDSVYGFASKTVKDLTIGQVTAGWNKYEQMIEATQTIMAATRDQVGEGLPFANEIEQMETINGLLDKLLWYTDETSYSFTDMAANVGKFLAAGTGLEDTFTAMMGIASWGATAGAKPTEVSRAMYNISQAMGSGSMMAVDWRSVENAGMATLDFKKNALIVSQELGKLQAVTDDLKDGFIAAGAAEFDDAGNIINMADEDVEKLLITAENFRETLQDKWFDKDVMMEVFRRYGLFADLLHEKTEETGMEATDLLEVLDKYRKAANDPESYSIDWQAYADDAGITVEKLQEVIAELDGLGIAYSETGFRMGQEAKTFTDAIEATKDAVSSRWMQTFKYIFGDYLQAKTFWTQVTTELYELFASSGDIRNDILDEWSKNDAFGRSGRDYLLGGWDEEINGQIVEVKGALWNLIDAIHTFTDPIKEAFAEVFGFDDTEKAGQTLRELTMRFQQFTAGLGFSEEAKEGLKSAFTLIFTGARTGIKVIGEVVKVINKVIMIFGELSDGILSLINGTLDPEEFLDCMKNRISALIPTTDSLKEGFKSVGKAILGLIPSEQKLINIFSTMKAIAKGGWASLKNLFSADSLKGVLPTIDQLRDGLEKIKQYLATNYPLLYNWIKTLKETSVVGNIISGATKGFESLTKIFSNLNIDTSKIKDFVKQVSAIGTIIFDGLFGDPKELRDRIGTFVSTVWHGIIDSITKISFKDVVAAIRLGIVASIAGGLINILQNLKNASEGLNDIPENLSRITKNIGDTFGNFSKSIKSNIYIKIALAIGILTASIMALQQVNPDKLMQIAVVLSALMYIMAKIAISFSKAFSDNKVDIKSFKAFGKLGSILISFSILIGIVSNAIAKLSAIEDKTSIWNAAAVIGVFIGILGSIAWLISKSINNFNVDGIGAFSKTLLKVAGSFILLGLAIKMLTKPIISISEEITKVGGSAVWSAMGALATLVFAISLALSAVASAKFGNAKETGNGMLKAAIAMVMIGFAVKMLIAPLITLSSMRGTIIYGLGALTSILVLLVSTMVLIAKLKISDRLPGVANTISKTLLKVAGSFILLGLAIKMLTKPIISISEEITKVGGSAVWSAMGALATLVFAISLALSAVASAKFGNAKETGNGMLKAAIAMVMIGFAVKIITGPLATISSLANYDKSKLFLGFLTITGILAGLSVTLIALNKFGSNSNNGSSFMKAALAMIVLAFAVKLLVGPLVAIGEMGSAIFYGLGALAGILILLGSTIALLSKLGDGEKLLKVSKAIGILGIGIGVLVGALSLLGGVIMIGIAVIPWELLTKRLEGFKESLGTLLGLAGAVTLFGAAILIMGAGIAAAGTGLLKAAIGFVIFSFGLGLFSDGIIKVSAAIPTFIENLKKTGQAIMDAFSGASTGQLILGAVAIGALVFAIVKITSAFSKFLSMDSNKVTDKFKGLGKGILAAVGTISKGIGPTIMAHLPEILSTLVTLVSIVGLYVLGLIPNLVDWIGSAIITLFESISQFIRKNKGALEHSIFGIVEVILEVIADAGTWVITVLRGLINGIASGLLNWIADMVQNIPGIGEKLANGIRGFADKLPGPEELMAQWNAQKVTDESFLKQFIPPEQEIVKTGKEIPEKLGLGVEEGTADLQETLSTITENFTTDTFSGIPDKAQEQGQLVLPMFAEGMLSGEGEASTSVTGVGERMVGFFDSLPDSASTSGTNFLTGWTNGFIEKWNSGEVTSAIQNVGGQIVDTLNDATGVHSPSIYARETGQYFLEGLALGLGDEQDGILTQVTGFGDLLVRSLSGTMAQVGMIADEDLTLSPRITPVVDLTNLNQASGIIRNAFGKSYGVSTSVGQAVYRRMSEMEDIAANMQASSETTYSNDQFTFNIYATEGMNENDIANAVMQKMRQQFSQRKVAFG